jgi:hypothetical protein
VELSEAVYACGLLCCLQQFSHTIIDITRYSLRYHFPAQRQGQRKDWKGFRFSDSYIAWNRGFFNARGPHNPCMVRIPESRYRYDSPAHVSPRINTFPCLTAPATKLGSHRPSTEHENGVHVMERSSVNYTVRNPDLL